MIMDATEPARVVVNELEFAVDEAKNLRGMFDHLGFPHFNAILESVKQAGLAIIADGGLKREQVDDLFAISGECGLIAQIRSLPENIDEQLADLEPAEQK
ncbi:MAG TPA: hypothetical protein VM238_03740 [Phycisphaerae bacterium]|nr:hypothetical protein [Phycisphaerae bacterium]